MAHVSIRWSKDSASHLKYVQKERGSRDVTYASDCNLETAAQDFENIRKEHRNESGNQTLHVVQAFSPEDSQRLSPEEINLIGRKLAEENFKGHQFVVRTHTDKPHFHNHIVVNTVNADTGKKIENKRRLIDQLRASSDKLCLENGLSIINREAHERRARLPHKVQQMVRHGRKSWVFDLVQKADVARTYATSYDEYSATLAQFKIGVQIEDKNITYFYPGRKRGKRGSKLGRFYDKEGLEEAFKENDKKYALNPELKTIYQKQIGHIQEHGLPQFPESISRFSQPWSGAKERPKDYGAYTKVPRRYREMFHRSERELVDALAPISEIKRARQQSILDYCKQSKIALITNEKGQVVLKGKEFVTVTDFEAKNTKNGTTGSLIDFVVAHKNISLLQAVAHINKNPRLLLLEQHLGEVKRSYTSFYIPTSGRADRASELGFLQQFVRSFGGNPSLAETLRNRNLAHASKDGMIRLFAADEADGALEFVKEASGSWTRSSHGRARSPFYSAPGRTSSALIFGEPTSLLRSLGLALFGNQKRDTGILGLIAADEALVHQYMAEHAHVRKIQFVPSTLGHPTRAELDFFGNLKAKYQKLGITVELVSHEKALELAPERRTPDHGLSL